MFHIARVVMIKMGDSDADRVDKTDDDHQNQIADDNAAVFLTESDNNVSRNYDFSIALTDEVNSSNLNPCVEAQPCTSTYVEAQPFTSYQYKIVGNNIDKNIRASFQRLDHQTKLLHYFYSFAVKDHIDFSTLSEVTPHYVKIEPATLLPGPEDLKPF